MLLTFLLRLNEHSEIIYFMSSAVIFKNSLVKGLKTSSLKSNYRFYTDFLFAALCLSLTLLLPLDLLVPCHIPPSLLSSVA